MSASSAVAGAIAVIPSTDGSGPTLSGGGITANTVIKTQTVTLGSNTSSGTSAATGLKITNVYVTDSSYNILDDTALGSSGGYLKIVGTGFKTGCAAYINGSSLTTTFVSSTQINIVVPSQSVGVYSLMIFNTDGNGAIYLNLGVSNFPTFTTSAGSLGTVYETTGFTQTIAATGDTPFVYSLYSGTLPSGATLNANGAITGTSQAESGSNTYSFVVNVKDAQNQDTQRSFSLTINTDVVSWSSPANNTIYNLTGGTIMGNVTLSATSAAGYNISYAANTLPTGVSLSGNTIYGTPTTAQTIYTELTATAATTNRSAKQYISWSVQLGDPQFNYTTLLLNGETSVTPFIADASTNNFPLTIAGDTRADKFSPYYGDGYYSNYLNGSTSYISTPSNIAFAFGTGDFTLECWVYPNTTSYARLFQFSTDSDNLDINTTSAGTVSYYNGSVSTTSAAGLVKTYAWNHIAMVRASGTVTIYVNGTSAVTQASTPNTTTARVLNIGGQANSWLTGYISNLRLVKGTAVYTSAFTPSTTPLTAIANTALLTCQSNRFKDNSTNAFALTVSGTPQVSPAIPFAANSSYSTYGSAYFDGTGDYLTVADSPSLQLGTGDFTIECWFYSTTTSTEIEFVSKGSLTLGWALGVNASNKAMFLYTQSSLIGSVTISPNTWYHFAVSRQSNTVKTFINGVQDATTTVSDTFNSTDILRIGLSKDASHPMFGYIQDLRIVKGTALYTTTFTPPTTPLTAVANTQLLTLQYNGGGNNYGIIDNGPFNNVITRAGNATQGTFSPYSQTGWSNYFNGTTDFINVPSISSMAFGTGNFTVEMWLYPTGVIGAGNICLFKTGTTGQFFLQIRSGIIGIGQTGVTENTTWTGTIVPNTWQHLMVTRSGSTVYAFLNGTSLGSFTNTVNYGQTSSTIGAYDGTGQQYAGYISNFRVLTGTALYTSTFTPSTTPLTAVANTSLLTCQSNRFIDNSPNNLALTTSGTPSVQAFSPFGSIKEAVPLSYSTNFTGTTGAYITASGKSGLALGTSDFTIECWLYKKTAGGNAGAIYTGTRSPNAGGGVGFKVSTNDKLAWNTNVSYGEGTTVLSVGQWYHVAFVRISGTLKWYINGVLDYTNASFTNNFNNPTAAIGITDDPYYSTLIISNFRLIVGTGLYTTNFTVPTSPLTAVANTQLLTCQSDTLIDNSSSPATMTSYGTTTYQSKVNPFGYTAQSVVPYTPSLHGGSAYFDGTGDKLTIANYPSLAFGANAFTIQCWFYTNVASTEQVIMTNGWASYAPWLIRINSSNQAMLNMSFNGGSWYVNEAAFGTVVPNQWYHVAVTRSSGGTLRAFLNGVQGYTTELSTSALYNGSQALTIGGRSDTSVPLNGYISGAQIINGTALYTSNFTPPTAPPTSTSDTTLLCNFTNGGIVDAHSSNVLETVGNAQLSTAVKKYGNSSMYFDGTGDYLLLPSSPRNTLGGGDFTVEFWFNTVGTTGQGTSGEQSFIGSGVNTASRWMIRMQSTPKIMSFWLNTPTNNVTGTTQINTGQWYHVALVRNGSGTNNVKLYLNGVLECQGTNTYVVPDDTITIGRGYSNLDIEYHNGYLDDLRITKGYARYTANFTPPTSGLLAR